MVKALECFVRIEVFFSGGDAELASCESVIAVNAKGIGTSDELKDGSACRTHVQADHRRGLFVGSLQVPLADFVEEIGRASCRERVY